MVKVESFRKALIKLKEILKEERTEISRDATIQRFEFTFEIAWKSTQAFLREEGIVCRSPKDCFKKAFKYGLIEDSPLWIKMIEDRNLTAHTYNENIAEALYSRLNDYIELFEVLSKGLLEAQEEV